MHAKRGRNLPGLRVPNEQHQVLTSSLKSEAGAEVGVERYPIDAEIVREHATTQTEEGEIAICGHLWKPLGSWVVYCTPTEPSHLYVRSDDFGPCLVKRLHPCCGRCATRPSAGGGSSGALGPFLCGGGLRAEAGLGLLAAGSGGGLRAGSAKSPPAASGGHVWCRRPGGDERAGGRRLRSRAAGRGQGICLCASKFICRKSKNRWEPAPITALVGPAC